MCYKSFQLAGALASLLEAHPNQEKKILADFVRFLEEKKITWQLKSITRHLEKIFADQEKRHLLQISTAHKLSPTLINKIKKYTSQNTKVKTQESTEPELIAGFIAEYNGVIYDASLAGQLIKLKTKF